MGLGLATGVAVAALGATATKSMALSLREAMAIAVDSNPEIAIAIARREAIEFELRQGKGRYLPSIDLESSFGVEVRDNATTRANGDEDHAFNRRQASVVVRQLLFDGFETLGEVQYQAARVDSSSWRVFERSEFIGLAVVRQYLDILRLRQIVRLNQDNVRYHISLLGRIEQGTGAGSLSVADRQQAQERVFAARARVEESIGELRAAESTFIRLVGRSIGKAKRPRRVASYIPGNLDQSIGAARTNHPSVQFAQADVTAAYGLVKKAESRFYPKVILEGRASKGHSLGGLRGSDDDVQGNVVVSWNLFRGGIDKANREEQVRRVDEARMSLHKVYREVEEGVRLAWFRRLQESRRLRQLRQQETATTALIGSYTEQFSIGQRSLLDLLDTQNTRVNARISVVTAEAAVRFAEYRMLASMGILLKVMNVTPQKQSKAYAIERERIPPTPPAEKLRRESPSRDALGPLY